MRSGTALAIAVLAVSTGCGDGEAPASRMTAEIAGTELIVSVDRGAEGGPGEVELVCKSRTGVVLLRRTRPWPFTDTDSGTIAPHVHEPLGPVRPDEIARCSIEGAGTEISATPTFAR